MTDRSFRATIHSAVASLVTLAMLGIEAKPYVYGQPPTDNLDAQLLEELSLDLPEVDAADSGSEAARDAPTPPVDQKSLDRDLQDNLVDGEDLGQRPENPLQQIADKMANVQRRIRAQDISLGTRKLQDQIVSDLDALIETCKKNQQNCNSGQCQEPGQNAMAQADQKPPSDSTTQLQERQVGEVAAGTLDGMAKETWGNLPPRVREAMVQAGADEFLPKYRQLIEDYFRSLSQEQ